MHVLDWLYSLAWLVSQSFNELFENFNPNPFVLGPPITSMTEQRAHVNGSEIATGPFIMKTPLLTTYSQQLWVIAKLSTSNTDGMKFKKSSRFNHLTYFISDERYDKSFQVSVSIEGITADHKLVPLLKLQATHNR